MEMESKMLKLSAKNYSTWKVVMQTILRASDVFDFCITRKTEAETEEDKEEYTIGNENAKKLMYLSMEPQQIAATGNCETAYDLWHKIKENHEGAETDLRINSLADLLGIKHRRDESIIQFCGRFEITLGRLETTGYKVDDPTQFWAFKQALSNELKREVNIWMTANPNGKLSSLITHLKIQYHSSKVEKEESTAFYGGERSYKSNNNNNYNNRARPQNSRPTNNNNQRNTEKNKTSDKFCTYCKMSNHLWKECRKLKEDNDRKKRFANQRQNQQNQQSQKNQPNKNAQQSGAFTARNEEQMKFTFTKGINNWIVDSGATSHMTCRREIIENYQEFEEPKSIILGNGKRTNAYGEGKMNFTSKDFAGTLESVLWVPELKENLFSVGQALKTGSEVKFTTKTNEVQFLKKDKIALKGYKVDKGLFVLHLKPKLETNKPYEVANVTLEEWHARFAHCSKEAIKELIAKNAVKGLTISQSKEKCLECAHGKICRASHPSRSRIFATKDAAILHIDTVGPFSTTSLGGSKYFVLATEEYSNYRLVEFVQQKSEVKTAVKNIIKKIKLEAKRPVAMIVTDNGTEYNNANLEQWLDDEGIIHLCAADYTPEQNGRAERSNRTIIEAARTLLIDSQLHEELWCEAVNFAVYSLNRTLSPKFKDKTRYELYYNEKPDVRNLRRFGEQAVLKLPERVRSSKWSSKGENCVLVGYTDRFNTYRFLHPQMDQIIISSDAIFLNKLYQPTTAEQESDENEATISLGLNNQRASKRAATTCGNQTPKPSNKRREPTSVSAQNIDQDEQITLTSQTSATQQSQIEEPTQTTTGSEDTATSENDEYQNSSADQSESNHSQNGDEEIEQQLDESINLETSGYNTRARGQPLLTGGVASWFWQRRDNHNSGNAEIALFTLDDEPRTLKDAQESDDWPRWKTAMDEEMEALEKNKTWTLVTLPPGARAVKNKWVFKIKLEPCAPTTIDKQDPSFDQPSPYETDTANGTKKRYRARLVVKGYSQIPNVDYKETFAPVASMTTVRIVFSIANQEDMELIQFDVKTAFLYGDLNESIYMVYPDGYPNLENKVCKLNKSLYGLKQAPRQWNTKFDNFLKVFKLQQSSIDKCLYYDDERTLFLAIYVDDGLVAAKDKRLLEKLMKYLKEHFELKVMECQSYLGFKIKRDRRKKTLFLSQAHYIQKILERFKMTDCKPSSTPQEVGAFSAEDSEPLGEEYPYKELIGSLLYLVCCTRPDIAHALSIASRTSKPTLAHWKILKKILRYLKGTTNTGILFRWEKFPELIGYSDADYANDIETRRSTTGYCIMLGQDLLTWRCSRQDMVTLSTTEAEYVSGCELVKELLPIREILLELKQIKEEPTTVFIDNLSTVKIAKNDGGQQRTKHIDVRSKWLNEQYDKKKIEVKHISGDQQAADILTKPLHKTKFITNRNLLLTSLAMCCMLGVTSMANEFTRVTPLYFKPTNAQYFTGDTEFIVKLVLQSPCDTFFQNFSDISWQNEILLDRCHKKFREKISRKLQSCTELKPNEIHEIEIKNKLARPKRAAPVIFTAITLMTIAGIASAALVQAKANAENIKEISNVYEHQNALLNSGSKVFETMRDGLGDIKAWSADIETQVRQITAEGLHGKIAARIQTYEGILDHYEQITQALEQEMAKGKMSKMLNTLPNEPIWEEPAAEWSTLYSCKVNVNNKTTELNLHFNMPIRDGSMKIMEAVHVNFYNMSTVTNEKNEVCWFKYRGPKHILVNTTNNCMTEIIEWAAEKGSSVRSQTCKGKEDEIKFTEDYWEKDGICHRTPPLSKLRIQDREVNGLHRIYCYPFNITIENKTLTCPDYPFELEGRTTYRIANLEHFGSYVERTINIKTADLHFNDAILQQMRADKINIRAFNISAVNKAYETYYEKLQKLPKKISLKSNEWLGVDFFQPFKDAYKWITDKFEVFGIILGITCSIFLLIVLAPVIEILLLSFSVGKWITRIALNITNKFAKLNTNANRRTKRYLQKGYHSLHKVV